MTPRPCGAFRVLRPNRRRCFSGLPARTTDRGASAVVAQAGFTLLELMVVVAMISLLVALLIPSLAAVRRQAKQSICQSNLRTIAVGWHEYLLTSKGKFLKSGPGCSNAQTNFGGRQGVLDAYRGPKPLNRVFGWPLSTTKGAEVFRCPFDRGSGRALPTYFDYRGNSYHTNLLLVGPPGSPGLQLHPGDPEAITQAYQRVAELDLAEVTTSPSLLLLLGDLGWYNAWEASYTVEDEINWHTPTGRHNIVYLDGHVLLAEIEKGKWGTASYTLIPFLDLASALAGAQQR